MNKTQLLEELKQEGFSKPILDAFSKIKRENFIPQELKLYAYNNEPLPIGKGATISQPYTIAFMLKLLELDKLNIDNLIQDKGGKSANKNNQTNKANKFSLISNNNINKIKILEIGSGCGYVLALINELVKNAEIYGIEIIKELADESRQNLRNNKDIQIIQGDGSKGISSKAPFDRILISASAKQMPEHLFEQLSDNGILVCPVRNSIFQIKNINNQIKVKEFPGFVFVPLVNSYCSGF